MRRITFPFALALALSLAPRAAADKLDALTSALLTDGSFRARVQAAATLGKLKMRESRAVQALIEALRDQSDAVRLVAAGSLGQIGDPMAADGLRALQGDASPQVRAQATKALAAIERSVKSAPAMPSSSGRARFYLALSALSPGKADASSAGRLQEKVSAALGRLSGVTLSPGGGASTR